MRKKRESPASSGSRIQGEPMQAFEGGMVVPREESAPAEFATKRLRGGSPIERAEPGTEAWMVVFDVPNRFAFAEGWVQ